MADDRDDGQKTEDPSQRKLTRARAEGQVAQSREITTWFMLAVTAIMLMFMAPQMARSLGNDLVVFITPERFLDDGGVIWGAVLADLSRVLVTLAAPLLLLMLAGIGGTLVQTGLVFATDKIGFDFSHLSPGAGLKRVASLRAVIELFKSAAKMALVAAIAVTMLGGELDRLPLLVTLPAADILAEIERLVLRLLFGVLMVLTVLAGADYLYQRLQHLRSLRMSKREVKDEMKQSEGDPMVKGRLRQIRMDRARRRMMAAVPTASVVITNPTHYAVALKYDMGASGAPRVVAKGSDLVALRIREIAAENDVAIVENPPLARALHAGVELDSEIPPEHYKAVAEIIGYVFRLKGKIRPHAAAL